VLYMSCGIAYGIQCGSQSMIHMGKFKGVVKESLKSVKVVTAGRCLRCEVYEYTIESGRSKEYT
jgi:hypothetical protein